MTTLSCPAKVNLYLAILGRDSSGYHEIDTVYVRHDALHDQIEIEPAAALEIHFLPSDGIDPTNNTISKAIRLLESHTGRRFTYKITVCKNIPLRSGLGGASSDAATLLLYLNAHESLGLTPEELTELGAQIGMDIPFFLSGFKVARGTHFGEIITPLPALPPECHINLGFTNIPVSTQAAFAEWDRRCLRSTAPAFSTDILQNLHNDFEQIFPDLSYRKANTVLSGSGGAYGILT